MPSFIHAVYFWFSLVFLIARTLAVSLYSAQINDESKKPLLVIRSVPRASWCLEVAIKSSEKYIYFTYYPCPQIKRFFNEVTNEEVALSGMQFFHITRKLVLSVKITFEIYNPFINNL